MWNEYSEPILTKEEIRRLTLNTGASENKATLLIEKTEREILKKLPKIIEGMEVSVDVSTGEDDATNRLFGIVNECMDNPSKNGMILLVYETEPNFTPKPFIPEGWQLVPIEPTEEMHHAARDWSVKMYGKAIGFEASHGCYKAMLATAPKYTGENADD